MVLEDAVISLCNEDGGSEYQIGETNEEGKVIFNIFLSPGTFYYKEVQAPEGFIKDDTIYSFTINNDGSFVFNNHTDGIIYNEAENKEVQYKVEYYFEDTDEEVQSFTKKGTEINTIEVKATAEEISVQDSDIKEFDGFTFIPDYEENVTNLPIDENGNITFKLYYKRNYYNITYELNGGQASGLINRYKYGQIFYLNRSGIKNGNMRFVGWYESSDFSGNIKTVVEKGEYGDKTFYAKWSNSWKIFTLINMYLL